MSRWRSELLLLPIAALLAFTLYLQRSSLEEPEGTDNQAQHAIEQTRPGYQPWFVPVWQPANAQTEGLLFTLQASLGAGILGYVIGRLHGRSR